MESNEVKLSDLALELYRTTQAIYKKWGSTQTPFGHITHVLGRGSDYIIHWPSNHAGGVENSITVNESGDATLPRHNGKADANDIMEATNRLATLSQHFAGHDWLKKIEGSMGMMKRIQRATEGETGCIVTG